MKYYKTFEDFLANKHAEQYTGLDDDMPDDYEDWFYNGLQIDEIIKYADEYAEYQRQEMVESVKKTMTEWESVTDIDNPASIVDLRDDIIEKLTQTNSN